MLCKRGFTLIELMVVIAILGTLASIALPSYNAYIVRARNTRALAQLPLARSSQVCVQVDTEGYYGVTQILENVTTEPGITDGEGQILDGPLRGVFKGHSGGAIAGQAPVSAAWGLQPYQVASGVIMQCSTGLSLGNMTNNNYICVSIDINGDTAYGLDSDLDATIFWCKNHNFGGTGTISNDGTAQFPPDLNIPLPTSRGVDFGEQDCGGAPTTVWVYR